MTFRRRSLEADNPVDIRDAAEKLLQKLKIYDGCRADFDDVYETYFGSREPRCVVKKACKGLIVHETSPLCYCGEGELLIKEPSAVNEYCEIIKDEPIDLLEELEESPLEAGLEDFD